MEARGQLDLVIDDVNMLEDVLARLIGSNLAGSSMLAKNTGSSLLLAHAGSKWAQKIMNHLPIQATHKIVIDALEDTTGRKMVELLKRNVSSKGQRKLEQQLEAWLLSAGTRYVTEEEKKPQRNRKRPGPVQEKTPFDPSDYTGEVPVFHKGGLITKDAGLKQLAEKYDAIPDLQRDKQLRQLHHYNNNTFNQLLDYLENR